MSEPAQKSGNDAISNQNCTFKLFIDFNIYGYNININYYGTQRSRSSVEKLELEHQLLQLFCSGTTFSASSC